MALSDLTQIINTLQELERMHQLHIEMLEQLDVIFTYIIENDLQIPNKDKLFSLLSKNHALLNELCSSNSLRIIQYRKLSDGRKHIDDSDTEVTVPYTPLYKV
jgi:hypothetical protein